MEEDSVTLHTGFKHIIREGRHIRIEWYFNDIHIAQRNESVSKICTDLEQFRDRLKLNHHTGDLSIRHIKTSDSGLYKLQINIRQHYMLKMFILAVGEFLFSYLFTVTFYKKKNEMGGKNMPVLLRSNTK